MSRIVIQGGKRLSGSVTVHGSKNATLPVMAASILNKGITVIRNYPDISDVNVMQDILEYIGCRVYRDEDQMVIDSCNAVSKPILANVTGMLRASSILMGPMLARFGYVQIAQPGGCNIGSRPLDLHMNAFKRLGASWEITQDAIKVTAGKLTGNDIYMRFPSVGATENAIMAAVCARGETVIKNAAKEPEIIQLCEYLRNSGADITGEGTDEILISGVQALEDSIYTISADRIVAGTYIAAVAACKGNVLLKNCRIGDCTGFLDVYSGMGVEFVCMDEGILVTMNERPKNLNYIVTGPFPEFPTDMQSLTLSVASIAQGNLSLCEKVFESRFKTAAWLNEMGADVKISEQCVTVTGKPWITGTTVEGADLRGTAALVVAGLCARGQTVVENADFVRRGYVNLCENFEKLGAQIRWEDS